MCEAHTIRFKRFDLVVGWVLATHGSSPRASECEDDNWRGLRRHWLRLRREWAWVLTKKVSPPDPHPNPPHKGEGKGALVVVAFGEGGTGAGDGQGVGVADFGTGVGAFEPGIDFGVGDGFGFADG